MILNESFESEFGKCKIGFLIRKFEEREDRLRLITTVRETFRSLGWTIIDASEKTFHQETWSNIKVFMENCSFGVVVIDNLSPNNSGFNPNVFLEIGYMLALNRNIFILIQQSLVHQIPTDIKPFLYTTFDSQEIESDNLKNNIRDWIKNNINDIPTGSIELYLKGEFVNVDLINQFKQRTLQMSQCKIIETSRLHAPDRNELNRECIECPEGVRLIKFKTRTKGMASDFESDYINHRYDQFAFLQESILKLKINSEKLTDHYPDGGIQMIFNDDKESLIFCQNDGIRGCTAEENFAKSFFTNKEVSNRSNIEIVIIRKFNKKNTFLYVSNFKLNQNWQAVKILHAPKDKHRIVLPFSALDILHLFVLASLPAKNKLKENSYYRDEYLKVVDYHIDMVQYYIEDNIPIEPGIAQHIKYFKRK